MLLDRYRAVSHAWYLANKAKVYAASRAWQMKHRERHLGLRCDAQARRRARMRGADGKIQRIYRRAVWEREGGACGLCAEHVPYGAMHLDHIKPLSRGGSHTEDNVQPSHAHCNLRKGSKEVPRWVYSTVSSGGTETST